MSNKTELPGSIKGQMHLWREGVVPLPKDYILFHKDLAERALDTLVKDHGLTLHRKYEADQGWMDGMKVVFAVVEEKSGRLVKLSWHDGNQEFFEHGCGSFPYRPNPKRG